MNEELIKDIKEKIFPIIQNNDKGHDWDHGVEVFKLAKVINTKYNIYCGDKDIITAGLLHDIGVVAGRTNHHLVGVWMLEEGHYSTWFNSLIKPYNLNKKNILNAIREHRASTNSRYSSPLSRLISIADRGVPDIFVTVKRLKDIGHNVRFTINHIFEKYSENGYIVYDEIYKEHFGDQFKQFMSDCNNIDLIVKIYESC